MVLPAAAGRAKFQASASASAATKTVAGGPGGRTVTVDEMKVGGSGAASAVGGRTVGVEHIEARFVVNAAGSASDAVAGMINDRSFKIKPRLGDYLLLHRDQGYLANATLFPCPGPLGKGILVQSTLWGNLILGPTARDMHNEQHANQTATEIQAQIMSACKKLVSAFDAKKVIHAFNGARAKSDRGDWIIEASQVNKNFINVCQRHQAVSKLFWCPLLISVRRCCLFLRLRQVAGIDSPGLAGSPAIALEVVRLLGVAGLELQRNPTFNPNRAPIITPKPRALVLKGPRALKMTPEYDPSANIDPAANVVCKCERVTEAEIVEAMRRSLPVDSTQAIRKRTRAGMGHCQGDRENYDCECRVADIIARELDLPVEAVGRRPWPATSTLPQRWLTAAQKSELERLAE